ncbi:hypothetical protein NFC81_01690 [Salinispirillum sp. LH 10-3-1]|uniref:Restriction endonuclease subunit S n=1 Tax=Salinispirillum sp. LH 10-3-1 TaxID=2952525 RepID=A0AB38YGT5_9GAMM
MPEQNYLATQGLLTQAKQTEMLAPSLGLGLRPALLASKIAPGNFVVRRVDQLFAHADRIEQQVNNALARVNNLTQSILAKAFRGELTEEWRKENPELISGEHSAEALLERVKAERAAMTSTKLSRKSKANV